MQQTRRTVLDAGAVKFALQYRQEIMEDQGLSIEVLADIDGREVEVLRFDCFDQQPHYHYGPAKKNERLFMDKTTAGNSIGWTLTQLRIRLPEMLRRAGYDEIADRLNNYQQATIVATKLSEAETIAREMAGKDRRTVTHNRGDEVIEAGNIRFGIEMRDVPALNDGGLAIHVLGDVAGHEIELLAFDCFDRAPHYHYGPRNKDVRIYWDTTLAPDTLRWTLDQFKGGNLPGMIERAGYPGVVAELDQQLIISKVENEVEPRALAIRETGKK